MFISTKEKLDIFHAVGVLMDRVAALEKHHHVTSARSNNTLESTMSEEKLPAYFHSIYLNTLTVFKRREDAPPEIIYRAEMAAPKPWVGLTDEEILQFWHGDHGLPGGRCVNVIELARFVEVKLKEKNT